MHSAHSKMMYQCEPLSRHMSGMDSRVMGSSQAPFDALQVHAVEQDDGLLPAVYGSAPMSRMGSHHQYSRNESCAQFSQHGMSNTVHDRNFSNDFDDAHKYHNSYYGGEQFGGCAQGLHDMTGNTSCAPHQPMRSDSKCRPTQASYLNASHHPDPSMQHSTFGWDCPVDLSSTAPSDVVKPLQWDAFSAANKPIDSCRGGGFNAWPIPDVDCSNSDASFHSNAFTSCAPHNPSLPMNSSGYQSSRLWGTDAGMSDGMPRMPEGRYGPTIPSDPMIPIGAALPAPPPPSSTTSSQPLPSQPGSSPAPPAPAGSGAGGGVLEHYRFAVYELTRQNLVLKRKLAAAEERLAAHEAAGGGAAAGAPVPAAPAAGEGRASAADKGSACRPGGGGGGDAGRGRPAPQAQGKGAVAGSAAAAAGAGKGDKTAGLKKCVRQARFWSKLEHSRFLEAVKMYGGQDAHSIAAHVGTRTVTQVRTHAQKYFIKLAKLQPSAGGGSEDGATPASEASTGQSPHTSPELAA